MIFRSRIITTKYVSITTELCQIFDKLGEVLWYFFLYKMLLFQRMFSKSHIKCSWNKNCKIRVQNCSCNTSSWRLDTCTVNMVSRSVFAWIFWEKKILCVLISDKGLIVSV